MKYRKKPVVIEAVECTKGMGGSNWSGLPKWLTDAYEKGIVIFLNDGVSIKTLEGDHKADIGDMIIQGVRGEIYPCKPDIFKETYEEAE